MEEKKYLKISMGTLVCLIIIVLLVVIVIGFGMYIYFLKNNKIETSQPIANVENIENAETEEVKKSIKLDETKEYVYEKDRTEINETIDYGGGETFDFTDTITLPFVNINSEDAKQINESLQQRYDKASTSLGREDKYSFGYTAMGYKTSLLEGKMISIETQTSDVYVPGGDFLVDYKIYNIDLSAGKQMSNSEILEMFNLTEAKMDEIIRTNLQYTYYEIQDETGSFEEFMATCEPDNYQIFVSNEKTLEVYIPCTGIPGGDSTAMYTVNL